ncbi:hypothetical protein QUR95_00325 [Candidatus Nasuia deltocephalinicola]|nr:hypothetical protein QUR95_00325 [Candidatus Nasuia deltocephalinicola]
MNKLEAYLKYGRKNVNEWLNNYNSKPPEIKIKDKRYQILKKI